ncbi:MAG: S1 RNA-binding domain-containing protein [Planctomycetia bacterium]
MQLGADCSQLERRAEAAERELVKLKLLIFMSGRIGEQFKGVVTGVDPFGLFVQGLGIPAEGLVALESLPDDTYRFERSSHSLVGRRPGHAYRLGDRLEVKVLRVDLERRTLDFGLVEEKPSSRRAGGRGGPRRSPAPRRGRRRGRPGG